MGGFDGDMTSQTRWVSHLLAAVVYDGGSYSGNGGGGGGVCGGWCL